MKIHVIINPRALRSRPEWILPRLARNFSDIPYTVDITTHAGQGTELAGRAASNGYDMVVAVGGDGTVNEVLNGIMGKDTRLGIIPTGTANDLASHLGIPNDVDKACEVIRDRHTYWSDAISVNNEYYLTFCGFGLPSDAITISNRLTRCSRAGWLLRRILKSKIYVLGLLPSVLKRAKVCRLQLRIGHCQRKLRVVSLIIGNQPVLGNRFRALPDAVNDDGILDAYAIEEGSRRLIIRNILASFRGRHLRLPNARMLRTGKMSIVLDRPTAFFGDGEIRSHGDRFVIRAIPRAVRIIIPRNRRGKS